MRIKFQVKHQKAVEDKYNSELLKFLRVFSHCYIYQCFLQRGLAPSKIKSANL